MLADITVLICRGRVHRRFSANPERLPTAAEFITIYPGSMAVSCFRQTWAEPSITWHHDLRALVQCGRSLLLCDLLANRENFRLSILMQETVDKKRIGFETKRNKGKSYANFLQAFR